MKAQIPQRESPSSAEAEVRLREEQLNIPNMTHPDSPIGKDDSENVEIRRSGDIPQFSFEPKDHVEIGEISRHHRLRRRSQDYREQVLLLARGCGVAGVGAHPVRDGHHSWRSGYEPTITPDLARDEALVGTGFIPRGPETQIYSVERHRPLPDRHSGDHTRRTTYADEILDEE